MIKKILFITFIIILSIIIIYIFIKHTNVQDSKNGMIKDLKNINKLESSILKNNEKMTFENIKISIHNFINNRISSKYKLSEQDMLHLKKNLDFITNQVLNELLKLYSVYEIFNIISTDPYNIHSDLIHAQIDENQLFMDQQIAGIDFLLNKYPKIDPTSVIQYIQKYPNIFKIKRINFKNNKPDFSK